MYVDFHEKKSTTSQRMPLMGDKPRNELLNVLRSKPQDLIKAKINL